MPNARLLGAVIVAVGAGFSALQLSDWSGQPAIRFAADLVVLAIALFATVCAATAARRLLGRRRAAWACVAFGAGGFAAGQLVWAYNGLVRGTVEFQSWADVGYAMQPIGTVLGLMFLLGGHPRATRLRVLLDGVIMAGALFGATWVMLLNTVYAARVMKPTALALTLAYPFADIAVVTIALLLLVRVPAGDRAMVAMLTAGLVLIAVADTAYAYVTTVEGQYLESISLGYAWGFLAIGGAALVSRGASRGSEAQPWVPSRVSMWLPFVPVTIAVAVCAPVMVPMLGPLYIVGIITVFAVMIRQYLVLDQSHRLLAEVSDQVMRDPLTGLASRTLFQSRLDRAMEAPRSDTRSVAVLLMDLDDFKLVNDSHGHAMGDAMLVRFAERLSGAVRPCDTAARLGGDEFAVLMEGDDGSVQTVAQRVVHAFDGPFTVAGHELWVRPSVGLAMTMTDGAEITADELLMQADVAMYAAKKSRSGGLHVFGADMAHSENSAGVLVADTRSRAGGRIASRQLTELRLAIEHGGLSVVYQPKFDVRTRQIVGVEALVRWPHPRRGLLVPEQFLPLVREHGLMRSVTSLVLDRALDDAARWYAKGVGVPVAVNVFAPSISDTDLPGQLVHALDSRCLPPEILTVEITEDQLLQDMAQTPVVLTMLRDCRIRIAIDDFGSGYSALWYLRDFLVDEVKLDREFIAPILTQPASAAIVRAVIDLAHVLGVIPVAEGVENAETAARLLEYGCDVAQGYYYSPPLPAPAVLELLESQRRVQNSRDGDDPVGGDDYEPDGTRRSEIELMQ
ncbi:putative bifunctional diguanylate cyclase/phosphodiesterase [Mycolicibacterium pyrenivorans]|uniref:putative bifunctional diguanylate cyclase/phosphodiesterase n=1 Tax=Mycolicibacterium pyrenivorans TaxID=187102 RepID=UPI0021F30E5C|nr:GGDEF domain-containing phosphodiesterase [Mycolicibacterium pyrenivorans]MCV7153263.1 EAL domain-containing protein [Mycolicibacterium pyrenivorans]